MKILAIETSCDETAIAILECGGDEKHATFTVLGNALLSQIDLHKKYGGVFPALAKREHAKNLVPILEAALEEAELLHEDTRAIPEETRTQISEVLVREPGLAESFFAFISECEPPALDAIAVTTNPGLEPALWVGVNFAKALALLWEKPLVAVNHMEGHIFASLLKKEPEEKYSISDVQFPLLALLISGGHTQLVVMRQWLRYELVGETRDDAVGEAFDKVARMLALPYPGGPEISKLAENARHENKNNPFTLPRPMLRDTTCDFSFAGLKTAVLYLLKDIPNVSRNDKKHIAHEFENAVADVLWGKTSRALAETDARTLAIGGGVSANMHIRRVFTEHIRREHPEVTLYIPTAALTTDNAIMIALAGYYRCLRNEYVQPLEKLEANGNRSLA
ncbi:MAG: tRNA (adenosine(37)-N6)-threonylcarbamoyltransferase complex transferase subunit TsaD [Minisyncoccia bacterium]|jgi:N6-L-threonylcarbamoyladenine synthase